MTSPAEAARRLSAAVTADRGECEQRRVFCGRLGDAAVGVDAAQRVLGPRQGEQALLARTQAAGVRPPVRTRTDSGDWSWSPATISAGLSSRRSPGS
jgi:hypothetical protein